MRLVNGSFITLQGALIHTVTLHFYRYIFLQHNTVHHFFYRYVTLQDALIHTAIYTGTTYIYITYIGTFFLQIRYITGRLNTQVQSFTFFTIQIHYRAPYMYTFLYSSHTHIRAIPIFLTLYSWCFIFSLIFFLAWKSQ